MKLLSSYNKAIQYLKNKNKILLMKLQLKKVLNTQFLKNMQLKELTILIADWLETSKMNKVQMKRSLMNNVKENMIKKIIYLI